MATTDFLDLNRSEMFAHIRSTFKDENKMDFNYTQNLLESKDDLLFAWDPKHSHLLVINWRASLIKGHDGIKYQTLIPSSPLNFQVERVLASHDSSYVALAGPHGITVLELPRRWGPNGDFMEGKERVTCRSTNLDARFFNNNPHLELRQVRWYPESPTDSHLLVLLSDNTMRLYDNCVLRYVWVVGPLPIKVEHSSSLPIDLGEIAVDFDIAPAVKTPIPVVSTDKDTLSEMTLNASFGNMSLQTVGGRPSLSKSGSNLSIASMKPLLSIKKEIVEWPIVILRENGNIYILMSSMDTEKPRLQGPITITPQAYDNYGIESCSILIIPSLPTTLVIAESNGRLHHAVLIEAEDKEDSFNEIDSSLAIYPSEWTIHVYETVELELGISKDSSSYEENSSSHSSPIHMKRDFINELRYFAYHNAGLHVVTVNFIQEFERFLESEVESDLPNLTNPSSAEYLVCTKIDSNPRINAVLGFVLLQSPSGIVLLLASGQIVSLKLVIDPKLLLDPKAITASKTLADRSEDKKYLEELLEGPSFVDFIKNKLKREVTQPILSVAKTTGDDPRPSECYALLSQAIEVLRTQYIERHKEVRLDIRKRVDDILRRKKQQLQDIESLEKEREVIRERAHRLAERCEELNEQKEVLMKKSQNLLRLANTCLPSNLVAEQEFKQEVEKLNRDTKALQNGVNKARESVNKQNYHMTKFFENNKLDPIELPERHEKTIREVLTQLSAEIDNQIKEIKQINRILKI